MRRTSGAVREGPVEAVTAASPQRRRGLRQRGRVRHRPVEGTGQKRRQLILFALTLTLQACARTPTAPAIDLISPLPSGSSVVLNTTLVTEGSRPTGLRIIGLRVPIQNDGSSPAPIPAIEASLQRGGWKLQEAGGFLKGAYCASVILPSVARAELSVVHRSAADSGLASIEAAQDVAVVELGYC